jgi:UDP-N-acetylmuramoyl-L-alanyl-D-glutamate--2,6-diaminopimelate ligase
MQYGRTVVTQDLQVGSVQYDSRKVQPGDMFVAIQGNEVDGHAFIDNAVTNGAIVVVVQNDAARSDYFFLHAGVVKVVVPDTRGALARIAANYYGHPSRSLLLVGVTGTNGKTTTTHLIKSILEAGGERVGLLGTIEYAVGDEVWLATHTTPESLEVNSLLARMVQKGCSAAVMEVSSHSLVQHRVDGLSFRAGTFTNLTQDHLDYHGTMEEYFRAKKMLFDMLGADAVAITNIDDPRGLDVVAGTHLRTVTYGSTPEADIRAVNVDMTIQGLRFSVETRSGKEAVSSSLTGRFNVANILAAYATGVGLGLPVEQLVQGIARLKAVRGRFEKILSPAGWTAVVDYAHTPDALENCLKTIDEILPRVKRGRIITIFGCGGNRDTGKRPIMGRIASRRSDVVIVTSDNPRRENPKAIIEQVIAGVEEGVEVYSELDRRKAIVMGLDLARPGDIVLVAGKGHENYQVVGDTKSHLDDREEIENYINAHP